MGKWHWRRVFAAAACVLAISMPASAQNVGDAFNRGYREGLQQGQRDLREGREPQVERNRAYRQGDRGYQDRYGSREVYRNDFRRGFSAGYRDGYGRWRAVQGRRNGRDLRLPRGYQEPAFARGYSDGWEKGVDDGRDRDRYDPVRHGDYRDADDGYSREYGSKDAYKNNYRAGFRQGYEDGYREGARRR